MWQQPRQKQQRNVAGIGRIAVQPETASLFK
jgi:hypothetical protein